MSIAQPDETTLTVFVAEDNAADLFWLEMVFKNAGFAYSLEVARDGETARKYLANRTVPDLILLDLNLPRLTALELLKNLPGSERLPLCILTGSENLGSSGRRYITKPLTQAKLADCLRNFEPLRPYAEKLAHRLEETKC